MGAAGNGPDEPAVVSEYRALFEPCGEVLERLLQLLGRLTGAPMALVTTLEGDRVVPVARYELSAALDEHVGGLLAAVADAGPAGDIAGADHDGVVSAADTLADPVLSEHPLVTGAPLVRSVAAVELSAPDGVRFGHVWVLATEPGELDADRVDALHTVASLIVDELELARRGRHIERVEAELEESARERGQELWRFVRLAESMPLIVWTAGPDGSLDYANPAYYEYRGVEPDEVDLAAGDWLEGVHPDDRERVMEAWTATIASATRYELEFRIRDRHGHHRWHVVNAFPITDEHGAVASWFGAATDVHEQHRWAMLQQAETRIFEMLVAGAGYSEALGLIADVLSEVTEGSAELEFVEPAAGPDDEIAGRDPDSVVVTDSRGGSGVVITQRDGSPVVHREVVDRLARLTRVALDRIRADTELRESTWLLRFASVLSGLGGFSYDVATDVLTWSDQLAAIHGRPPGHQPTVDEAFDHVVPEHREMYRDAAAQSILHGTPYDLEVQIVPVGGTPVWCRVIGEVVRGPHGEPARTVGAFQDIDELKRAELALRESEERFRLLSVATSDVVFDWNVETDEIWYGEGLEEWVGGVNSPVLSIELVMRRVHPDDLDRALSGLWGVLESGEELWSDRFRLGRADGTWLWVEASGLVMRDEDGRAQRLVGSLVDMTSQQALEQQLAQSQRLESVGQLTGGVAHDFNNLLTVILGNVDLLLDDLDDDDHRSMAEMVRMAAERGAQLTRQLLAFARRQPLAPTVVEVTELTEGLSGLLRRTLGEDVDLRVTHAPDLRPAMVDASQLESAVLNVCLNARDAMPGGGHLTIETANVRLDDAYTATQTDLEPGAYVMIAISDTGAGMSDEVLERAFEPFFTTKAAGSGTGLGLSMVYGFAKQSRGHVRVYSEVGRGTTVRLYLPPAATGADEAGDATPPSGTTAGGGGERVLVVEDDELVRSVVAVQLRSLGYDVVVAADGDEALRLLQADPTFALLFTDVVMPGALGGRELAEAARRVLPDLPVLFTSGYSEDAIVHHGRLDAGVELLSKPYRIEDLAARVRHVLDTPTRGTDPP